MLTFLQHWLNPGRLFMHFQTIKAQYIASILKILVQYLESKYFVITNSLCKNSCIMQG